MALDGSNTPRKRKQLPDELPPMKTRFCVGEIAVPTFEDADYEGETFVSITKKSAWLIKALGIDSLAELPEGNLLQRMRFAIEALRGKHTKMMAKVDAQGNAQGNKISISVDGRDVEVLNSKWPIQFRFSPENISWVMQGLLVDLKQIGTTHDSPASLASAYGEGCSEPDAGEEHLSDGAFKAAVAQMDNNDLPKGCSWSSAKRAYLAGTKERKRMTFRARAAELKKSGDEIVAELKMQRRRAEHYLQTGEMLQCQDV